MLKERVHDTDGPVHVLLDEGGVRCAWHAGGGYVPFAELTDATLDRSFLGHTRLVLVGTNGEELRLRLENANPLSVQGAILVALRDRKEQPSTRELPAALIRSGRALDAWLEDLAALAGDRRGYREADVDHALLADIFADEHGDIDARSAAAYVLVSDGDPASLRAVARAFVLRALPPLVLVAARVARGGAALVSDDVLAELRPLLTEVDRAAVDRACGAAARDPDREAEVNAALHDAIDEATAEARRVDEGDAGRPHASGARRLHRSTSTSATAWVGRSWAL